MYLCCSEVEFQGMLQWAQKASEESPWTQVCNDQGHKHSKTRHWEGVQHVQRCSREKRLQDFCHPSEEKFKNVFHSFFFCNRLVCYIIIWKLARDDKGELLLAPEWSVFWKTEYSRISRKRSELSAIFFIQYWGILISFRFASFVTPRITSTKT